MVKKIDILGLLFDKKIEIFGNCYIMIVKLLHLQNGKWRIL